MVRRCGHPKRARVRVRRRDRTKLGFVVGDVGKTPRRRRQVPIGSETRTRRPGGDGGTVPFVTAIFQAHRTPATDAASLRVIAYAKGDGRGTVSLIGTEPFVSARREPAPVPVVRDVVTVPVGGFGVGKPTRIAVRRHRRDDPATRDHVTHHRVRVGRRPTVPSYVTYGSRDAYGSYFLQRRSHETPWQRPAGTAHRTSPPVGDGTAERVRKGYSEAGSRRPYPRYRPSLDLDRRVRVDRDSVMLASRSRHTRGQTGITSAGRLGLQSESRPRPLDRRTKRRVRRSNHAHRDRRDITHRRVDGGRGTTATFAYAVRHNYVRDASRHRGNLCVRDASRHHDKSVRCGGDPTTKAYGAVGRDGGSGTYTPYTVLSTGECRTALRDTSSRTLPATVAREAGELVRGTVADGSRDRRSPRSEPWPVDGRRADEIRYLNADCLVHYRRHDRGCAVPTVGGYVHAETRLDGPRRNRIAGQVLTVSNARLSLRRARHYGIPAHSVTDIVGDAWIERDQSLMTVRYRNLTTGDIVQGIPKVERVFEARRSNTVATLPALMTRSNARFDIPQSYLMSFWDAMIGRSIQAVARFALNSVQGVYQSQGVNIADKHLEIILRQMTAKVTIVDPGDSGLLFGDLVYVAWIRMLTPDPRRQRRDGRDAMRGSVGRPPIYVPTVQGITRTALGAQGFLAAASFQETVRVLARAAVGGRRDFLGGLKGNVIMGSRLPMGTAMMFHRRRNNPPPDPRSVASPHNSNGTPAGLTTPENERDRPVPKSDDRGVTRGNLIPEGRTSRQRDAGPTMNETPVVTDRSKIGTCTLERLPLTSLIRPGSLRLSVPRLRRVRYRSRRPARVSRNRTFVYPYRRDGASNPAVDGSAKLKSAGSSVRLRGLVRDRRIPPGYPSPEPKATQAKYRSGHRRFRLLRRSTYARLYRMAVGRDHARARSVSVAPGTRSMALRNFLRTYGPYRTIRRRPRRGSAAKSYNRRLPSARSRRSGRVRPVSPP